MNKKFSDTLTNLVVVKRSGQRVNFNGNKIAIAIKQAFDNVFGDIDEVEVNKVYENVLEFINKNYKDRKTINVEDIQDIIEQELNQEKYLNVYNHFKSYRQKRSALRKVFDEKQDHKFARTVEKLSNLVKSDEQNFSNDMINKFGKIISTEYAKAYILENKFIKLLEEGIIEINNLDEYMTSKTSGAHLNFSYLKADNMNEYIDNLIKIVYKCKTEQFGEHSITSFDYIFVDVLVNEFKDILKANLKKYLKLQGLFNFIKFNSIEDKIDEISTIGLNINYFNEFISNNVIKNVFEMALEDSLNELKNVTYYNLKRLLLSLEETFLDSESSDSKVSISFGTNYDCEEAVLIRILYLKAISEIDRLNFVNTIYKINKINEDELKLIFDLIKHEKNILLLFEQSEVGIVNQNGNILFNELEVFSTGERVYENVISEESSSLGRILLSTTSVNLARLGLEFKNKDISLFYDKLSDVLEVVKNQLVHRFELQGAKYKEDYKFLFQNNLIYDNAKLENNQKIRKVIRNGVLNIGLVGLYECSVILGQKRNEKLAFEILDFIKNKVNEFISEEKLNFIVSETYNNDVLEDLISIDKSIYGIIPILNKNKYDNFCKIYDDLEFDARVKKLGKFQKEISSRVEIRIPKKQSVQEFIEVVKVLQKNGIVFCQVEVN